MQVVYVVVPFVVVVVVELEEALSVVAVFFQLAGKRWKTSSCRLSNER